MATRLPDPFRSAPRWLGLSAVAALALATGDAVGTPWDARVHWQAHAATDKPIYRPGEWVWARTVLLDAVDQTPVGWVQAQVQVLGPDGAPVWQEWVDGQDSVLGCGWRVPPGQPGGEYTLKVTPRSHGVPPATRRFEIRQFRERRLETQLEFVRKGYGPGDTVTAVLEVRRAEGGVPAGATVVVVARVDGREVHRGQAVLDSAGRCTVSAPLPAAMTQGEGTLACVVTDGGVVETAATTIPILLQRLDLAAFPEGGDLVAGVRCGLYLQARTPWGDPADVTAEIVDDAGVVAATLVTTHEGRGRADFTPVAGRAYRVRIARPAGIATTVTLPAPLADGVSVQAVRAAYGAGEPVSVRVTAAKAGAYRVTLARADVVLSQLPVELAAGEANVVTFHPAAARAGVLRVTVFDADGKPRAERLVFRHRGDDLHIAIEPDRTGYVPGQPATVRIRTTDAYGQPVSAVVGLTVTDRAVLEMIERRRQAPRLAEMVWFESEVDRLDDAQVYLGPSPEAAAAVDLLLGTQGWRRFAFEDTAAFIGRHGDAGRRALSWAEPPLPQAEATRGWGGREGGQFPMAPGQPAGPAGPQAPASDPGEAPPAESDVALAAGELQAKDGAKDELEKKWVDADDAERDDKAADGRFRERLGRRQRAWRREYAHVARPDHKPGERRDFTETLYWNAGLTTDAKGEATFTFALSDRITTFLAMADGFTADGRLGSADAALACRAPLFVEPKVPLEVTAGDRIWLPIAAVNGTGDTLTVQIAGEAGPGLVLPKDLDLATVVAADGRGRCYLPVTVGQHNGRTTLTIAARAGAFADTVTRTLTVRPYGFPARIDGAGLLQGAAAHIITVPAGVDRASVTTEIKLYPHPLASLTEALASLIAEPYGCFEQTSSTSYPMVMAQRYFTSHAGVDPALVARANALIDASYQRLTGFECKDGGYEWFGQGPAHECLTAYGLLQFRDMQPVYAGVSAAMLDRTIGWLMGRRNAAGGFDLNPRYLHDWGCPDHVASAYILWALTENGEANALAPQVGKLVEQALEHPDTYFRGLLALACHNVGRAGDFTRFAQELTRSQTEDGFVKDAATTVVRSGGQSLLVETTALAALAWLRDDAFAGNAERAVRWLLAQNQNGRFGSTQATVLALRAIVERDAKHAKPRRAGAVSVLIDGAPAGRVEFTEHATGAIALPDFGARLTPGKHRIELRMEGGAPMPYSVRLGWFTTKPDSSAACALRLETALASPKVREGESVEVAVTVRNVTEAVAATPVAIVGLPGGCEPRHEQLQELVRAGTIAHYEVRGRDVVCYFTQLAAGQVVKFRVDCVAAVPGAYRGDASRAYCYYTDEHKAWVDGLAVEISPR